MTKGMHTDDRCILCVPHFFGLARNGGEYEDYLDEISNFLLALLSHVYPDTGYASDDNEPRLINQVNYSVALTTSGQQTEAELALVAEADYGRVIFLAFTNHQKAVANEDTIVTNLGSNSLISRFRGSLPVWPISTL